MSHAVVAVTIEQILKKAFKELVIDNVWRIGNHVSVAYVILRRFGMFLLEEAGIHNRKEAAKARRKLRKMHKGSPIDDLVFVSTEEEASSILLQTFLHCVGQDTFNTQFAIEEEDAVLQACEDMLQKMHPHPEQFSVHIHEQKKKVFREDDTPHPPTPILDALVEFIVSITGRDAIDALLISQGVTTTPLPFQYAIIFKLVVCLITRTIHKELYEELSTIFGKNRPKDQLCGLTVPGVWDSVSLQPRSTYEHVYAEEWSNRTTERGPQATNHKFRTDRTDIAWKLWVLLQTNKHCTGCLQLDTMGNGKTYMVIAETTLTRYAFLKYPTLQCNSKARCLTTGPMVIVTDLVEIFRSQFKQHTTIKDIEINMFTTDTAPNLRKYLLAACNKKRALNDKECSKWGAKWGAFLMRMKASYGTKLGHLPLVSFHGTEGQATFKQVLQDMDKVLNEEDRHAMHALEQEFEFSEFSSSLQYGVLICKPSMLNQEVELEFKPVSRTRPKRKGAKKGEDEKKDTDLAVFTKDIFINKEVKAAMHAFTIQYKRPRAAEQRIGMLELIQRQFGRANGLGIAFLVWDEAHQVRSVTKTMFALANVLTAMASTSILMTGTPICNTTKDFAALTCLSRMDCTPWMFNAKPLTRYQRSELLCMFKGFMSNNSDKHLGLQPKHVHEICVDFTYPELVAYMTSLEDVFALLKDWEKGATKYSKPGPDQGKKRKREQRRTTKLDKLIAADTTAKSVMLTTLLHIRRCATFMTSMLDTRKMIYFRGHTEGLDKGILRMPEGCLDLPPMREWVMSTERETAFPSLGTYGPSQTTPRHVTFRSKDNHIQFLERLRHVIVHSNVREVEAFQTELQEPNINDIDFTSPHFTNWERHLNGMFGIGTPLHISSKFARMCSIVKYHKSLGHKGVIFSQWSGVVDAVRAVLSKVGITSTFVCGRLAAAEREYNIQQFKENSDIDVLVCTLTTGAQGYTFTEARYMCMMDPWWAKYLQDQAEKRIHRVGQRHETHIYYLKATIPQHVVDKAKERHGIHLTTQTVDGMVYDIQRSKTKRRETIFGKNLHLNMQTQNTQQNKETEIAQNVKLMNTLRANNGQLLHSAVRDILLESSEITPEAFALCQAAVRRTVI